MSNDKENELCNVVGHCIVTGPWIIAHKGCQRTKPAIGRERGAGDRERDGQRERRARGKSDIQKDRKMERGRQRKREIEIERWKERQKRDREGRAMLQSLQ